VQVRDLPLGQGDDLHAGERHALEDVSDVLLVAADAIEGFRQHHLEAVAQSVRKQRLDAVPRPRVQRTDDPPAHGQLGERDRGRVDARHPVRLRPAVVPVGREQQVAVRNELERRSYAVSGGIEPAGVHQLPDVEGRFGLFDLQLRTEEEEPDSGAERLARLKPALVHRKVGRGEGDPPAPERLFDPLRCVPRLEESRPQ